jgi:hypothetical protein
VRQFGIPVQHKHECISEDGWTGARLDGFSRQMPPESARAGNRTEKSKDVTCNSVQSHATRQLTFDIGHQRSCSIHQRVTAQVRRKSRDPH